MEQNVPEQVQAQMEHAARIQAQVYGPKETPAPAENTSEATEAKTEPALQTEAQEPNVVVPETPAKPATEDFRHQYEVLKGKYSTEVPRLYQQLREKDAQMNQLLGRLEALEQRTEQEPAKAKESQVTDKDIEEYGADLMDAVGRKAADVFRQESANLIAAIERRFAQLTGQLGAVQEVVEQSAEDRFWNAVEQLVPDWRQIDEDPSWVAFLDTNPAFTTKTYRELANEAVAAGDPRKVAALVAVWRGPAQAQAQVQTEQAARREQVQTELQRQVAPPTSRASTPVATPKVWTGKEYEYVFSHQAAHQYDPAQLAALQADATAALAEGRVRW